MAVQQAFKPLDVRLLLYDHETSRSSFALCWKSLLPASEASVSELPSSGHTSSSVSYHLDLFSLGDPTGSNAVALRVTYPLPFKIQGKSIEEKFVTSELSNCI
jgi:hypothetical protein